MSNPNLPPSPGSKSSQDTDPSKLRERRQKLRSQLERRFLPEEKWRPPEIATLQNILAKNLDQGRLDVAEKIGTKLIPKVGIMGVEKILDSFATESGEVAMDRAETIIGHQSRKVSWLASERISPQFRTAIIRLVAETAVAMEHFHVAESEFEKLEEKEKAAEMKALDSKYRGDNPYARPTGLSSYKTPEENQTLMREACRKFLEAVKNTPEYEVDFEEGAWELLAEHDAETEEFLAQFGKT